MASGIRSIVWRSDIDAGRERPAFFLWTRGGLGGQSPADGTARGTSWRDQLTQLTPAFLGGNDGRKKGRREGKRVEERRGREMGRLFVKQIKTNKKNKCFRTCQTNCSLSSNLYHSSPQKYQIPAEKPPSGNSLLS